jgi:hypothetical protein
LTGAGHQFVIVSKELQFEEVEENSLVIIFVELAML